MSENGHHTAMIIAWDDVPPCRRVAQLRLGEATDALGALVDADQIAIRVIDGDRGVDVIDDESDQRVLLIDAGTGARLGRRS